MRPSLGAACGVIQPECPACPRMLPLVQVEMLSPVPIDCPISLHAPLCPQITPCGHVFSFPAIMQVCCTASPSYLCHPAVDPPSDRALELHGTLWVQHWVDVLDWGPGNRVIESCCTWLLMVLTALPLLAALLQHLVNHGGPELRKSAPCPLCFTQVSARELRLVRVMHVQAAEVRCPASGG